MCYFDILFFAVWGTGGSAHLHEPDWLIFTSIPSPSDVSKSLIMLYHYSVMPKNKKSIGSIRGMRTGAKSSY